jgi:hypothetical protein
VIAEKSETNQACCSLRKKDSHKRDDNVLKPILTSAAFAGALIASAVAMAQERYAPPAGSYLQSCRNAHIYGHHLTADCRRADGAWEQTSLFDLNRCSGDIANANGRLVCGQEGYGSSTGPEGYYRGGYSYGR